MNHYLKVETQDGRDFFIEAADFPLLSTDQKVTVFEQWPGCRVEGNGIYVSYTCARRSQVKTTKYIGSYLRVIK